MKTLESFLDDEGRNQACTYYPPLPEAVADREVFTTGPAVCGPIRTLL